MELQHLQVFLHLSHSLNFSKTAKDLHISQPGVTKIIRSIEDEVGLKLFNRNQHRVTLTNNGKYFSQQVSYLLDSYNQAINQAKIYQEVENSSLTIGFTGTPYELENIPKFIHHFKSLHSNNQIYIQNFQHDELKENLINHHVDAIFTTLDDINENNNQFSFFEIGSSPFYALIPSDFGIKKNKVNISDLNKQSMVFLSESTSGPELIKLQNLIEQTCPDSLILHANNISALTVMAKSGVGIIFLPKYLFTSHNHFIHRALINDYSVTIKYGLVFLKDNTNPLLCELINSIKLMC